MFGEPAFLCAIWRPSSMLHLVMNVDDSKVYVHRLEAKEGSKVEFDQVLLLEDKGKVNVGAPAVKGAKVTAKVENHVKGDKVIVFKKKRRKGYKKKNGHRQEFTELSITGIKVKKQPAAKAKEA